MKLTNEDILEVAKKYDLHPACIRAVIDVESAGKGFYKEFFYDKNGEKVKNPYFKELLCRFEGHYFRRYTKGKYDKSNPTLSFSDYTLGYKYNKGQLEFGRFMEAFNLDKEASWKSCSWGLFQIMGSWGDVLYGSTKEMLLEFYKGEKEQLDGFIKYCIHTEILDDLREQNWKVFAKSYNGKNYYKYSYDKKLEQSFNRWKYEYKNA
jgi:hypothetical protein